MRNEEKIDGPELLSKQSSVPAADSGIRLGGVPALPDWDRADEPEFHNSARSTPASFLGVAPANEEQKVRIKNVEDVVGGVPL